MLPFQAWEHECFHVGDLRGEALVLWLWVKPCTTWSPCHAVFCCMVHTAILKWLVNQVMIGGPPCMYYVFLDWQQPFQLVCSGPMNLRNAKPVQLSMVSGVPKTGRSTSTSQHQQFVHVWGVQKYGYSNWALDPLRHFVYGFE